MESAIITGITGQTGSYMAELLLEKGYKVIGLVRRSSKINYDNIANIVDRVSLVEGDVTDIISTTEIIKKYKPKFLFNFAAQSHVHASWSQPVNTFRTNANAVLNLLEGIRLYSPETIFYQASTSEMFGDVIYSPQDEQHPLRPRSVYGASKVAAHSLIKVYRESYDLELYSGISFNHESPRRGKDFVTRKITLGIAQINKEIKSGKKPTPIVLGNLNALRDWSHAYDICQGIWKMVNSKKNKDYVLASGETHTIKEFINLAFECAAIKVEDLNVSNIEPVQDSKAYQVNYVLAGTKDPVILVNSKFYRPAEVELLLGDSSLAREELNWVPSHTFKDLVNEMIFNDTFHEGRTK